MAIGSAVVELTAEPHTGCKKFVARFGLEAMQFVNSPVGRQLNLRGINTKVVQPGVIRVGDVARKIKTSGQHRAVQLSGGGELVRRANASSGTMANRRKAAALLTASTPSNK